LSLGFDQTHCTMKPINPVTPLFGPEWTSSGRLKNRSAGKRSAFNPVPHYFNEPCRRRLVAFKALRARPLRQNHGYGIKTRSKGSPSTAGVLRTTQPLESNCLRDPCIIPPLARQLRPLIQTASRSQPPANAWRPSIAGQMLALSISGFPHHRFQGNIHTMSISLKHIDFHLLRSDTRISRCRGRYSDKGGLVSLDIQ